MICLVQLTISLLLEFSFSLALHEMTNKHLARQTRSQEKGCSLHTAQCLVHRMGHQGMHWLEVGARGAVAFPALLLLGFLVH